MGRYSGRSIRLILMCVLSLVLFVVELSVAYIGNSLALASDAFAVLSHFISMIIGLLGVRFSRIRWHKKSTFGFPRADVVGAFGNSIFATALMFSILIEAIKRYLNPQKTEEALIVLIVGLVGLFFNVLNYVVFMDCCYCGTSIVQEDTETGPLPQTVHRMDGVQFVSSHFILIVQCVAPTFTYCILFKPCLEDRIVNFLLGIPMWLIATVSECFTNTCSSPTLQVGK